MAMRHAGGDVVMELDFTIKLDDNTDGVKKVEKDAVKRSLFAMGVKAVEGSVDAISGIFGMDLQAVDTGRLRASISFITPDGKGAKISPNSAASKPGDEISGNSDENSVIVGSNVKYAEYVHNGTVKMGARPFIRTGIDKTRDDMKRQVDKIFRGEL